MAIVKVRKASLIINHERLLESMRESAVKGILKNSEGDFFEGKVERKAV